MKKNIFYSVLKVRLEEENALYISILKYLLCPTVLLLELPSLSVRLLLYFPLTIDTTQVDELLSKVPFH